MADTQLTPTIVQPTVPDRTLNSVGTPQFPNVQAQMTDPGVTDYSAITTPNPLRPLTTDPATGQTVADTSGTDTTGSGSAAGRTLGSISANLPQDEQSQEDTILGQYQARQQAVQDAAKAKAADIQQNSNEDIYYQNQENQNDLTSEQEARRGFATNTALFQQMQDTGQKRIRDLEKQRDSALLQNDQNQADTINGLLATEQSTITTARQNYYQNMFSLLTGQQNQQQFEFGKTPTQRLNALAQIRQSLFFSGASPDELGMIDKLITDTATGGGVSNPTGGVGTGDASGTPGSPIGGRTLSQGPVSSQDVNNVSGYGYNGTPGSYKPYQTPTDSFNDTQKDIQNKIDGNTKTGLNGDSPVTDFVNTWITGNKSKQGKYTGQDVVNYLTNTLGVKGITTSTPISQIGAENLASAVAHFETGYNHQTGAFADGSTGSGAATSGSTNSLATLQDSYTQQLEKGVPPTSISATFSSGQYGAMQGIALSNAVTQYYKNNPDQSIGKSDINYASVLGASKDVADQAANRLVTIKKLQLATNTLQNLSDKFARSGVTTINSKWLQSQLAINNPDAIAFDQATKLIADDIGQVFASGGSLTDFKLAFGNGLIDQNYSPAGMKAAIANMNNLMSIQSQAYTDVLSNPSGLGTNRSLTGSNPSSSSSNKNLQATYPAGTVISSGGKQYIVGADGHSITPK